jgi:hypothetical protein
MHFCAQRNSSREGFPSAPLTQQFGAGRTEQQASGLCSPGIGRRPFARPRETSIFSAECAGWR